MRLENSFIFIDGVGDVTERRLWEAGIHRWDRYTPDALSGERGRRVQSALRTARARLADDDLEYFADRLPDPELWRAYENVNEDAVFLDIETTGLEFERDYITTVSIHRSGETRTFVRGDDLEVAALRDAIEAGSMLVTFNGKRFDVPFLEHSLDLDLDVPHLDLMYPCRRVDLTGGLKPIERDLGIERHRDDLSGRDAVRLWHEHLAGRDGALDTLVEYNRADTENLRVLARHVTDRLHESVFAAAVEETP